MESKMSDGPLRSIVDLSVFVVLIPVATRRKFHSLGDHILGIPEKCINRSRADDDCRFFLLAGSQEESK